MTIDPKMLPYRPGVGVMLLSRDHQVFVAKRIDMRSEAWQMPQGGIDEGENPREAMLRELMEEIGTDKVEVLQESAEWLTYDLPPELVPIIWKGRFRGQRQKWFALRFTGKDSDINLHTEHPEFLEWRWSTLRDVPKLIVPFKQELYTRIAEEFAHLIPEHAR